MGMNPLVKFLHLKEPLTEMSLPLQALWWEAKGDWEKAHELCQAAKSPEGDWVHAYLHRKEGDETNAGYWYGLAGRVPSKETFQIEAEEMISELLKLKENVHD